MSRQEFYVTISALLIGLIVSLQLFSQPRLHYKPIIKSLSSPVDIVNANDGSNRLFIVQKTGTIKVYDQSFTFIDTFLQVPGITTNSERGLLSMVFHPAYKSNGYFFVYYTNVQGNIEIARYQVSADSNKADALSKFVIITIPHPNAANHNGGKLHFGRDGYLYFATGDGGGAGDVPNNAQNNKSLLGKLIRIDINKSTPPLNYSIPPDNPYVGDTSIAGEIWASGLRNPWRWSFDRLTGNTWLADVGQNRWEEVNFRKAAETGGINYGWRCYEGIHGNNPKSCQTADKYISPIFEYPHDTSTGGNSVTGGYVYRGVEYPSLNGYYLFADYVSGNQWLIIDSVNTWSVQLQPGTFPKRITSFGEGEDGTLYACTISPDVVYRIEVTTDVQFNLLNFAGTIKNNTTELTWSAAEQHINQYEIQSSIDSVSFVTKDTIPAKNEPGGNDYQFRENVQGVPKIFYRLRVINTDGKWDHSKTITIINPSPDTKFDLLNFTGIARNNTAELNWSANEQNLRLYEIQSSSDSVNFVVKDSLPAANQPVQNDYHFHEDIQGIQKIFYRLRVIDNNGNEFYSPIISLTRKVEFNLLRFAGMIKNNITELNWSASEQHIMQYEIQSAADSVNFETKDTIIALNQPASNEYHFSESVPEDTEKIFYRLRVLDNHGNWEYSAIIALSKRINVNLLSFTGTVKNDIAELNWTAIEQNLMQYEIEAGKDSVNFTAKKTIVAKNQPGINSYNFNESILGISKYFYRLRIVNIDGNWNYSRIISLVGNLTKERFIYPSFITNKTISCFIPASYNYLQIFSMNGLLVLKKDIRGVIGRLDIPVSNFAKGIYMVKIAGNNEEITQKIVVN